MRLTTIATYRFAPKADVVRTLLAQEGVQAFVTDGNTVTADWFLSIAVGYAKLQVPSSQAQQALALLRSHTGLLDSARNLAEFGEDAPDCCLACGARLPEEADCCAACGWSYQSEADDDATSLASQAQAQRFEVK